MTNKHLLTLTSALTFLSAYPLPDAQALDNETARECSQVSLQALDKINAKTDTITAILGEPAKFENLKIIVRRCLKSGIAEAADTAIYVDIYQAKEPGNEVNIYKGWMFASSPSLATLDHPIFGVWVKRDQEHDKDTDNIEAEAVDDAADAA